MRYPLSTTLRAPDAAALAATGAQLEGVEQLIAAESARLAGREAEVAAFIGSYQGRLGALLVQKARLEEALLALLTPAPSPAEQARRRGRRETHRSREELPETPAATPANPGLKTLWRQGCRLMHPDRASTEADRSRRNTFLGEFNRAYSRHDLGRMKAILSEFEAGGGPAADSPSSLILVLLGRLDRALARLAEIRRQWRALQGSDAYRLMQQAQRAQARGRDLLAEMEDELGGTIAELQQLLELHDRLRRERHWCARDFR